jgi:hypothetical protein
MCSRRGLLGVLLLLVLPTCWGQAVASDERDTKLLIELKKFFENGNVVLAHWNGSDACSWGQDILYPDITCNDAGRVVKM